MVTVYCPNCGTKNEMHPARGNGFKECNICKMLLRYVKWRNQKAQLTGYLSEEDITKNRHPADSGGVATLPSSTGG